MCVLSLSLMCVRSTIASFLYVYLLLHIVAGGDMSTVASRKWSFVGLT